MPHVMTAFDRIVEDIGDAGQQLTALAACEGSAGNISARSALGGDPGSNSGSKLSATQPH